MAIIIKRNTGFAGSLLKFKVKINNEYIGKIAQGEEKKFTLPEENSIIHVKQFASKSNKLAANDGDFIEIRNAPWLLWGILILFILSAIMVSFEGIAELLSLSFVIISSLLFIYFIDSYKITKKNREF